MGILLLQKTRAELYEERLKYEKEILTRLDLEIPPENSKSSDLMQIYRAVENTEDIHSNDFIPKAFKSPFSPRIEYTVEECGISIFSNLESIRTMLIAYRGKQKEIAVGNFYSKWGKHGIFNAKSHANFYKYLDVDYQELSKEFKGV